jgi:hypothetical protein
MTRLAQALPRGQARRRATDPEDDRTLFALRRGALHWLGRRGDTVSSEYKPKFEFIGGKIAKVIVDIADDAYVYVERHLAAAMVRD